LKAYLNEDYVERLEAMHRRMVEALNGGKK
jgi:hypothetical protein